MRYNHALHGIKFSVTRTIPFEDEKPQRYDCAQHDEKPLRHKHDVVASTMNLR